MKLVTDERRRRAEAPEVPLLRFQQRLGLSVLPFALLCGGVVFLLVVAPIVIQPPDHESLREVLGSGLFFGVSIAIIAGCTHPMFRGAADDLRNLSPILPLSSDELVILAQGLSRYPVGRFRPLTTIALLAGLCHSYLLGSHLLPALYAISQVFGTLMLWLLMFWTIPVLFANAQLFSTLGRIANPDLLRPAKHAGFGSAALRPALFLIVSTCAYPLLLIGESDLSNAASLGVWASLLPIIVIVALPLRSIRKRINDQRASTLQAIDARLDRTLQPDIAHADANALFELDAVLDMRERVAQAPGWPLDVAAIQRILLYVVLPPLTWAAAAVVEMLVDGVL